MLGIAKKIYRKLFAAIMLLVAEITIAIVVFIIAFAAFLFVAKMIFLDKKDHFDMAVFHFMAGFVNHVNNHIMQFLTVFGNYQFLVTANLLMICYFLFIRKHRWYSIKVPAIALSSLLVMFLLKEGFNRPRPLIPLLEPAMGLSFPSGHAMNSVTFFGLLIYFISRTDIKRVYKAALTTFLILFILLIGLSRVYLRVHYASDVLGGFCAGLIWLLISLRVLNQVEVYSKRNLVKAVESSPVDSNDNDDIT